MTVRLNPYLSFRDDARQAMEFYESVFGGDLTVSTFADFHPEAEGVEGEKVMHSQLETAEGFVLMASDTPAGREHRPQSGVFVSLNGDDENRMRGYWDRLSEGGEVTMPFGEAPWGALFGMCVDRFGTGWMVNVST